MAVCSEEDLSEEVPAAMGVPGEARPAEAALGNTAEAAWAMGLTEVAAKVLAFQGSTVASEGVARKAVGLETAESLAEACLAGAVAAMGKAALKAAQPSRPRKPCRHT